MKVFHAEKYHKVKVCSIIEFVLKELLSFYYVIVLIEFNMFEYHNKEF